MVLSAIIFASLSFGNLNYPLFQFMISLFLYIEAPAVIVLHNAQLYVLVIFFTSLDVSFSKPKS